MPSLAELLAPFDTAKFFAATWEQRYTYVKRTDPAYYRGLLAIAEVDAYLALARRNPAAFVSFARAGQPVHRMPASEVEPSVLSQTFHGGQSILLEGVDRVWPPLFDLARALSRDLSANITINAYLTPPNSQGAHIHPDIHDVFAVHLEGEKHWTLYEERVFEPLQSLRYISHLGRHGSGSEFEREDVDMAVAETVDLSAGDLLYLPRGVVHKAATGNAPSLHLAIVVAPYHWIDVIAAAVEMASMDYPLLNRALPCDFIGRDTSELATSLYPLYREALDILGQPELLAHAFDILQRARMFDAAQPGDDHFAQLSRVDEIQPDTWMARRRGLTCVVNTSKSMATIRFSRNQVNGPAHLGSAFQFIRDHERFQVENLPGRLDSQSKVVLAKRLLREGLLRIDNPE